jgi:hypothetical protein
MSWPLPRRQMTSHEVVFVPDQYHHQDIEHGECDQPDAMRVGEPIKLVDDKKPEHDKGCRIGPELPLQKTDHQRQFHEAVAQQIERIEVLRFDGKILREGQQVGRDEIFGIFDQLLLSKAIDECRDCIGADQGKGDAAGASQQRMRSFQQHTDLEDLMNPMFVYQ